MVYLIFLVLVGFIAQRLFTADLIRQVYQKFDAVTTKFAKVDKKIQQEETISKRTMTQLLGTIFSRQRFKYTINDIFCSYFSCMMCRSKKTISLNKSLKKHYLFEKSQKKLLEELDVVSLIRAINEIKILKQTLLTQSQRMLLRFQRKKVIETASSSSDSDHEE